MFEKELVIEVTGQEGRRFWGMQSFRSGEETHEPMIGELTGKDNKTLLLVDIDGYLNGHIDGNVLSFCYTHAGGKTKSSVVSYTEVKRTPTSGPESVKEAAHTTIDNASRIAARLSARSEPREMGSTDDSASIAKAITYSSSNQACILFPHGTYMISSTILIPAHTCLRGEPIFRCAGRIGDSGAIRIHGRNGQRPAATRHPQPLFDFHRGIDL